MSLITCPECNKQISEYAEACPNCGYPIKNIKVKHDIPESILCPICGRKNVKESLSNSNMHCKVCGADLSNLDKLKDQIKQNQQQSTQQNPPKCPTCGSTNIEKISVGKKIGGSMLFGLFSSDVKNTMHCKDCGAKW